MSIAPLDGPFGCLAHGKAQLDSYMDSVTSWSIAQTMHKPVPGLQEKPLDARRSVKVSLPLRAVSGTQAKPSAGRNQAGELGFPRLWPCRQCLLSTGSKGFLLPTLPGTSKQVVLQSRWSSGALRTS